MLFLITLLSILVFVQAAVVERRAAPAGTVTFDLKKDFGAIGQAVTADTRAFREAAKAIMARPDKAAILNIPAGNYYIRGQRNITAAERAADPNRQFYIFEPILKVTGLKYLEIRGNGATLSLDWHQRFGAFELDGTVASSRRQHQPQFAASVGPVIDLWDATGPMIVDNLNFVTLQDKLVIGNEYGDTGIQLGGSAIVLEGCPGAQLSRITTKGMALDGITIRDQYKKRELGAVTTLNNVHCEGSGRQGLSWIGGNGLTVTNSRFTKTGRGKVSSSPKAGLDIEPNISPTQWTRNGLFKNCMFDDNAGPGFVAPFNRAEPAKGIDGGYAKFEDCTFIGQTTWSAKIEAPGISFTRCKFFGTVWGASDGLGIDGVRNPSRATTWTDCAFSDTYNGVKGGGSRTMEASGTANAKWTRCNFTNTAASNLWIKSNIAYGAQMKLENCRVVHGNAAMENLKHQSDLDQVNLISTAFTETQAVSTGPNKYRVWLSLSSNIDTASNRLTDYLGNTSTKISWWRQ
ncbi:hypothetical protein CC85DRAFT_292850 [Cutaneotrichosporon oleaginosum]|uniref:Uncharacterized protein n=1 Tax=Cutaneotrichosporon oleaginosum TaxID=879819 RepID=A0A0J1B0H7_9TREE|nr:uncharacterized protein CC85DRAFT_292850 [Cutaneotrichosporon oleaginosum]KLT41104.1 hypothetical protein CC85DRAFT_292850 [Cutaneotrichosporon oleaginosum]TXT05764.1 hypothetical protein COLE_07084 [Cutaneotrichosporon oleaginosum]